MVSLRETSGMSKRNNLILVFISSLLAACSSASVHSTVQANDHHMSCAELESEIQQMEANRSDDDSTLHLLGGAVRGAMSISGVLPLAVAANVVKDQPDTSEKRQGHLMTLYVSRGCGGGGQTQVVMVQPAVAPVIQPITYVIPQQSYSQPQEMAAAPTTQAEIEPLSATTTQDIELPHYSAEHIHNAAYLFE